MLAFLFAILGTLGFVPAAVAMGRYGPLPVVRRSSARAIHLSQFHLSHATVSGIVDRLAMRGFVTRSRSAGDRRSALISATDAGRALVELSPPVQPESLRAALTAIPDWDRLHLLAALERVGAMIDPPPTP